MSQAPTNNATMAAVPLGRQGGHSSIELPRVIRQVRWILAFEPQHYRLIVSTYHSPVTSRATPW